MDVGRYLNRIGLGGANLHADLDSLARLQFAHLHTVPFENLDIHLGVPLSLEMDQIYEKVVERGRGGICYELNGLFGWLLQQLGFDACFLSGHVFDERNRVFGPEFDHIAIMVGLDDTKWLVDVGSGHSFESPLEIADGFRSPQRNGHFRIRKMDDGMFLLAGSRPDKPVTPIFRFELIPRELGEFHSMCVYHQTSPDSLFTQKPLATMSTATGRITVRGYDLIRSNSEERTVLHFDDDNERFRELEKRFGILLEPSAILND